MMNIDLDKDNKGQIWSLESEATMYYTLTDASELISAIGLKNFLEALYHEKKGRLLTVEEHEAMETLHNNWEM